MEKVKAKKHLGQHFLTDKVVTEKISQMLGDLKVDKILEIGPGMGILTQYLLPIYGEKLECIEIDLESVAYLKKAEWAKGLKIISGDFLHLPVNDLFSGSKMAVIGNYPYNISTQIAFKVMENVDKVEFFGGMFQKEVAKRFCAEHGNKEYGITSVILQALFDCKYLFTVNEGAFNPPPKVKSGVIACFRKQEPLPCSYRNLLVVVKTAFSQRRKTLSNALKPLLSSRAGFQLPAEWQGQRAEQLSVQDFVHLTTIWEKSA
jgi:16S rRNA (adenine1518-N6/adenine1519-N6)-dimethyltransferase